MEEVTVHRLPPSVNACPVLVRLLLDGRVVGQGLTSRLDALSETDRLVGLSIRITLISVLLRPDQVVRGFLRRSTVTNVLLKGLLLRRLSTREVLRTVRMSVSLVRVMRVVLTNVIRSVGLEVRTRRLLRAVLRERGTTSRRHTSYLGVHVANGSLEGSFRRSLNGALVLRDSRQDRLTVASLYLFAGRLRLDRYFLALNDRLAFLLHLRRKRVERVVHLLTGRVTKTVATVITRVRELVTLEHQDRLFL